MVVSCEIDFDNNPNGTYFAGQTISGCVTLKTDKLKIVKGFALKIRGFARTKWAENYGAGSQKKNTIYQATEDYFCTTTYLMGSDESESVEIAPGIYTYTFACLLPVQCPSSFEGRNGHIRYTVKLILMRPWKSDQVYTKGFTVLKLLDLNYEPPTIRMHATQEMSKVFYCGLFKNKPLRLSVTIPQTGFVPGQSIAVTVFVVNDSFVVIKDLQISLIMLATMFSQTPRIHTCSERTKLAKIKAGSINKNTTRQITKLIRIPAAPPTCEALCRILKITYFVEVKPKLTRWHQSPIITIPIKIGNVPLVNVAYYPQFKQPRTEMASVPALDEWTVDGNGIILPVVDPVQNPLDPLSSAELNIAPPSYEEATHMNCTDCTEEEENNILGGSQFLPRYPVYNISQPSAPLDDEPFTNTDPNKTTWL